MLSAAANSSADVSNGLLHDLMEIVAEDPSNLEARRLLLGAYVEAGWGEMALEAALDLLLEDPADAETRALCESIVHAAAAAPASPAPRAPLPKKVAAPAAHVVKGAPRPAAAPPVESPEALQAEYDRLAAMTGSLLSRARLLNRIDAAQAESRAPLFEQLERMLGDHKPHPP